MSMLPGGTILSSFSGDKTERRSLSMVPFLSKVSNSVDALGDADFPFLFFGSGQILKRKTYPKHLPYDGSCLPPCLWGTRGLWDDPSLSAHGKNLPNSPF